MQLVNIQKIQKTYHTKELEVHSIDGLTLDIQEGEILAIVGPSGCGKSTLLNMLTHLDQPDHGFIRENKPLVIGYMMQNDALLPWLTVEENALLGLKLKHQVTKENKEYVYDLLKKYGLFAFKEAYPDSLSGGMRQRIALIRTLAIKPNILLLDEPFSKLDIDSRMTISDDVYKIIKELRITTVLISHDIAEALSLSDRLIVLSKRPAKIKSVFILDALDLELPSQKRETEIFKNLYQLIRGEIDHV